MCIPICAYAYVHICVYVCACVCDTKRLMIFFLTLIYISLLWDRTSHGMLKGRWWGNTPFGASQMAFLDLDSLKGVVLKWTMKGTLSFIFLKSSGVHHIFFLHTKPVTFTNMGDIYSTLVKNQSTIQPCLLDCPFSFFFLKLGHLLRDYFKQFLDRDSSCLCSAVSVNTRVHSAVYICMSNRPQWEDLGFSDPSSDLTIFFH